MVNGFSVKMPRGRYDEMFTYFIKSDKEFSMSQLRQRMYVAAIATHT